MNSGSGNCASLPALRKAAGRYTPYEFRMARSQMATLLT